MTQYPKHLLKLINTLKKLPGVGNRSAERFAFNLLSWSTEELQEMGLLIQETPNRLYDCSECGALIDESSGCHFCDHPSSYPKVLCIVASPKDIYDIEQSGEYRGLYHVLGGTLSPLDGRHPEQLTIQKLLRRLQERGINEIIIALDSTIEGDATSLYLKKELQHLPITISRLAFGLPMGSSLEFADGGTIAKAMAGRQPFN